jgi:hypothetical protein
MADANTAFAADELNSFVPLSGLRPRSLMTKLFTKIAEKSKSRQVVVTPGRRGLIVCFLQLLFSGQNRLEVE